ncbi:hypothetical protein [uncultured Tateyamaria sp.]|uniref:hypothetical protein n=1 Tax=uncultured Tateyamaria sp. TaxID=455651 RepID=UPI002636333D|nr:hypothetical protein [uncultured Tateyamaria sp.]
MKLYHCLAVIACALSPGAANAETVSDVLEGVRTDCASIENGQLTVQDGAVRQVDLTGDGVPDDIVELRLLSCSTAASLFCGTGGCGIAVIVDQRRFDFLVKAWEIVPFGQDIVLLFNVHGAECGGSNLRRCYEAKVWSEGDFRSVSID